ncbi:GNAT family N-acetyltransferase, partial [Candidatus Fermentibacteria bacterium]|nr:GNAT family N-acetyltransferase [Candidatus Fermentibacteria bacterium]
LFGDGWAGECETATSRVPASCFIAVSGDIPTGFACYDAACRGFFGPAGVLESHRGGGIGRALLHACLASMRAEGYAYAVIGGVAADCEGFYAGAAGAVRIEGSDPGIYAGLVRRSCGG